MSGRPVHQPASSRWLDVSPEHELNDEQRKKLKKNREIVRNIVVGEIPSEMHTKDVRRLVDFLTCYTTRAKFSREEVVRMCGLVFPFHSKLRAWLRKRRADGTDRKSADFEGYKDVKKYVDDHHDDFLMAAEFLQHCCYSTDVHVVLAHHICEVVNAFGMKEDKHELKFFGKGLAELLNAEVESLKWKVE